MRIRLALLAATLLFGLAALAQPAPDETWLVIVPTLADGAALPARVHARLMKLEGETRTAVGARPSFTPEGRIVFVNLETGIYEATIFFPTLGLTDGPRKIPVGLGYNTFTWNLPAIILVQVALTEGQKPVAPSEMQAFLAPAEGAVTAMTLVPVGDRQQCALFPGKYRLALFTEKGYGIAELDTATAKEGKLLVTLPLLRGTAVEVQVTNTKEKPIPGALVTLTRDVAKGFPVTITMTIQETGQARTPMLPLGEWEWHARRNGYQPQSDTVTVTAEEDALLEIELLKAR
jgi:hypothetical protein